MVVEPVGPERFPKKHIGTVKYEEFTLGIDLGSSSDVYTWISDSWKGQAKPREGAIVETDARLDAKARREFHGALITETTIPVLDAASKAPAELTLRIAPS